VSIALAAQRGPFPFQQFRHCGQARRGNPLMQRRQQIQLRSLRYRLRALPVMLAHGGLSSFMSNPIIRSGEGYRHFHFQQCLGHHRAKRDAEESRHSQCHRTSDRLPPHQTG
jgi:hypothetical protein